MTNDRYLHERGWAECSEHLHQQTWAQKEMMAFHKKQREWEHHLCTVCQTSSAETYICTRCKRDKHHIKKFSAANSMHPGPVPDCLQRLTQVEEMLIARACPIMSVYCKHGGQRGYKGHVLNMPQDVQGFLDKLPILLLRRHGADNTHADFRVRRQSITVASTLLQRDNN